MVMLGMTFPARVDVWRNAAVVAPVGVRVARSKVLAISVRVELRAIAGVFDNGLRQCGSCGRRDKSRGTNQCEFHLGLSWLILDQEEKMGMRVGSANCLFWSVVLNFNLMAPPD
jgi:hypothetical protein